MIEIRSLKTSDLKNVVELKKLCWTEELAGKAENTLVVEEELKFWTSWSTTAEENDDIRLLLGAFNGDDMLGVAIGSLAETSDIAEAGIELNGLWVYPQHRNKGISLMLLENLLDYYKGLNKKTMVIYNLHHSPSNTFYRKFGCKQVNQVTQMQGKLLVDIFNIDIEGFLNRLRDSLMKYR